MSGDRPDPGRVTEKVNEGPLTRGVRALVAMLPWNLLRRMVHVERTMHQVRNEGDVRLDALRDRLDGVGELLGAAARRLDVAEGRGDEFGGKLGAVAQRADGIEEALRRMQVALEELNTGRTRALEHRLDSLEENVAGTDSEVANLRDGMVPAAVKRSDLLLERLAFELEETGSLVERMLRDEPLPCPAESPAEREIASSLRESVPNLVAAFRGSEEEIAHRLKENLPLLEGKGPVLDLGCGRGEFLVLLREVGIEATGVERDPALAQGARRRGLGIVVGDVLSSLRDIEEGVFGAVTAFHLFEHLSAPVLGEVLAQVRRVLRPGGVLLAECPNPHSLRVGASLFWLDPTHVRPLLPETLDLALRAAGFTVEDAVYRHPFPDDQLFAGRGRETDCQHVGGEDRIALIERRLDELLNGARDFLLVGVKSD